MDKDPDRKARVEVELLQLIMLTHSVQIEVSFVLEFSLQQALYYISRPSSTSTNPPCSLHPSTKKTDDSI
jgi:hypothetical protein